MPWEMVSGANAGRMVRAPGMRLAKDASICVRSKAAELTATPFRHSANIRLLFAYGSMILAVFGLVVKKAQGVGAHRSESHNGSK